MAGEHTYGYPIPDMDIDRTDRQFKRFATAMLANYLVPGLAYYLGPSDNTRDAKRRRIVGRMVGRPRFVPRYKRYRYVKGRNSRRGRWKPHGYRFY